MISDIINLHGRQSTFAELTAQHSPQPRTRSDQYNFMCIKQPPFYPKCHVTKLWIVDVFGIDPGACRGSRHALFNWFYWFPPEARGKYVG